MEGPVPPSHIDCLYIKGWRPVVVQLEQAGTDKFQTPFSSRVSVVAVGAWRWACELLLGPCRVTASNCPLGELLIVCWAPG